MQFCGTCVGSIGTGPGVPGQSVSTKSRTVSFVQYGEGNVCISVIFVDDRIPFRVYIGEESERSSQVLYQRQVVADRLWDLIERAFQSGTIVCVNQFRIQIL